MSTILITDALDAMEKNLTVFLNIATGGKAGDVRAECDSVTGTASINHAKNTMTGKIDCHVRFPALPAQYRIGKDELDRWTGYFIHELSHAIFTDEHAWRDAVYEGLAALVNGLEDVRIERETNRAAFASNSLDILTSLIAWCVSELPAKFDPNDMSDLPWLFAMIGRRRLCGYALPQVAGYEARLTPTVAALVDSVMGELDKAQSTRDVLQIARRLKKQLGEGVSPKRPGKPGKPGEGKPGEGKAKPGEGEGEGKPGEGKAKPGEGEGEGQDSPGEGEGEGKGKPGEKPATATGKPATGDPKPGEGEGEGKDGNGAGGAGKPDSDDEGIKPFDVAGMNSVNLNPTSAKVKADSKATKDVHGEIAIIDSIRAAEKGGNKPFGKFAGKGYPGTLDRVIAEAVKAGKLRAQVARVLKSTESETWERSRPTGRLDRFALARTVLDHPDVFAKRNIRSGYETEIEVLCDGSGSMSGTRCFATATLAWIIAQAAAQVGVKCGVSRFTSARPQAIKAPNQSLALADVRDRFAAMADYTNGGTDLTGAIVQAACKLSRRAPGKRQLLFVVSDGECSSGAGGVIKANAYAKRLGVETVVLCIDTTPHPGFGLAVACDSRSITATGLETMVKALARE